MRRQATCNLLTSLSYPPWTKDVERVVYMTRDGEKRTPFYDYVRPSGVRTAGPRHSATTCRFQHLPEEVQLYILTMCSASTLFQLMHVSSKLRIEASKLFWAKENAYFLVESQWLLNEAYPGDSFWDMAFPARVQNVEVEYSPETSNEICLRQDEGGVEIQRNLITAFWVTLKRRFPSVTRVILNQNEENTRPMYKNEPFPPALQLLVRACPTEIKVSVLFLEKKKQEVLDRAETIDWRTATWQRSQFWQTSSGEWDKRKPDECRQTILMPPKQFRGPVGQFGELQYQCYKRIPLQRYGLWPLMVEALDRHYFDEGRNEAFSCLLPSCTAYFSLAGDWPLHAAKVHYQEWQSLLEILPSTSVGFYIRERSQALDKKTREVQAQFKEIRDTWFRDDETTQRAIQRSWMEQLNSDPAWETKGTGTNSSLWEDFMEELYSNY